jgi:hypothetical protein
MVPVLMLMLGVTSYSCQSSARRGHMFTGVEQPPKL